MKTRIVFRYDEHQTSFRKGDTGYIDGYVSGGDGRPCAVVVGDDGGCIFPVSINNLKAISDAADSGQNDG